MATSQEGGQTPPQDPGHARRSGGEWKSTGQKFLRNALLLLAAAVVLLAIGYGLAAFVPRWWAQWVGRRVDGSLSAGTVWGLFVGFVFTFVPLLVVWQSLVRAWIKPAWKALLIVIAVLIAAPNLMTLSIVVGTSRGAHAGERILDVDGPGFRAATLWGVIVAAAVFVGLLVLTRTNRSRGRRVRDLKSEIAAREPSERGGSGSDRDRA